MMWYRTKNRDGSVSLDQIPKMGYGALCADLDERLTSPEFHIAAYFAVEKPNEMLLFFVILLDDAQHQVLISSFEHYPHNEALTSLARNQPQILPFEREITERYGVVFEDSPWAKPLRFPFDRNNKESTFRNYPFFNIEGEALHEVNVGPIHAGIIEPGLFRFICHGEEILHLENVLGFSHRGVEKLIISTDNRLRQTVLAEQIAGDSSVAHAVCFCETVEKLSIKQRTHPHSNLNFERSIALELERIAMHIADSSALCADIGYQLGQVTCEALRTVVINTTQLWCGNRFGRGLIRPEGTHYPITGELIKSIKSRVGDVAHRFDQIIRELKTNSSVLSRFEMCGEINKMQVNALGIVGVAARASGLSRDIRASHPWGAYSDGFDHTPITRKQGDVMARLMVRARETLQSAKYISLLCDAVSQQLLDTHKSPNFTSQLQSNSLSFSLVEGWRGEICHVATTDPMGRIGSYKIVDPSFHNWIGLAISVRGAGISDFPICNKSFNLSYCGHDL